MAEARRTDEAGEKSEAAKENGSDEKNDEKLRAKGRMDAQQCYVWLQAKKKEQAPCRESRNSLERKVCRCCGRVGGRCSGREGGVKSIGKSGISRGGKEN